MDTIKQDTLWWQRSKREFTDLGALSKYFETCNRSDGKSKDTIKWYNQTLKQFEKFLITRRAEFHGLCPWVNEKAAI